MSLDITFCVMYHDGDAHYVEECIQSLPPEAPKVIMHTKTTEDGLYYTSLVSQEGGITFLEYGATEFHFANARNAMIEWAKTAWIMMIDADERLVVAQHKQFAELPEYPPEIMGIKSYNTGYCIDGGVQHYHMPQVKIFRNNGLRYFGSAHETINGEIELRGGQIVDSDMIVYHVGYAQATQEELQNKIRRNVDLLLLNSREWLARKDYVPHYYRVLYKEIKYLMEKNDGT